MITTIALFHEDKPNFRLGQDPGNGAGMLEIRSGLQTRIAIHSMSRVDLLILHDDLSRYLAADNPTENDFADAEARRQDNAAGSYAGCVDNNQQQ